VGKQLAHQNIIRISNVGMTAKESVLRDGVFSRRSLKIRLIRKQYDFIRERVHSILKQTAIGLAYMNAAAGSIATSSGHLLVNSAGKELRIIDFALAIRIEKPSFLGRLLRASRSCRGRAATCRRSRFGRAAGWPVRHLQFRRQRLRTDHAAAAHSAA